MSNDQFKNIKSWNPTRSGGKEMRGSDVTAPGAKRTEAESATNELKQFIGAPPPSSPLGGMNNPK